MNAFRSRVLAVAVLVTSSQAGPAPAQAHHRPKAATAHAKPIAAPEPATGQPVTVAPSGSQVEPAQPAELPADRPLPAAFRNIFYQPNALAQGSPVLFTVEMAEPASRVSGRFLDRQLSFFRGDKPNVWYALAGADLESAPGRSQLSIVANVLRKGVVKATKEIDLAAGDFKAGEVEVPENFVHPDAAGKRQIAADAVLKAHAYAHFLPSPQWSGDFKKPVDAPSTPSFGMTRLLNEEMTSRHRGTDFPGKEGSQVSAANAGTVVLAKEMFYEGNCVILDHGQHFFTVYMHLSKMDVKVGDKMKKEAPLGLTGATGRVTGPHLHMGVRWNGAYLDPVKLLALTLPETAAQPTEPDHADANRKAGSTRSNRTHPRAVR